MPETGNLIDGEQLKALLEQAIESCDNKLVFISAYITQVAVDWLAKHSPPNVDIHLICRLQPFDIISGATHIPALVTAIEKGWSVSCLHSLHAKIYAIDDKFIYTGSANLTSNGLKIYGMGNLEASVQITPSPTNLSFIEGVCQSSTDVDINTLQKMQNYIDKKELHISSFIWPVHILDEKEGIWVNDFFWAQQESSIISDELLHDMELLNIEGFECDEEVLKEKIWNTRCIQWLVNTLKKKAIIRLGLDWLFI